MSRWAGEDRWSGLSRLSGLSGLSGLSDLLGLWCPDKIDGIDKTDILVWSSRTDQPKKPEKQNKLHKPFFRPLDSPFVLAGYPQKSLVAVDIQALTLPGLAAFAYRTNTVKPNLHANV